MFMKFMISYNFLVGELENLEIHFDFDFASPRVVSSLGELSFFENHFLENHSKSFSLFFLVKNFEDAM